MDDDTRLATRHLLLGCFVLLLLLSWRRMRRGTRPAFRRVRRIGEAGCSIQNIASEDAAEDPRHPVPSRDEREEVDRDFPEENQEAVPEAKMSASGCGLSASPSRKSQTVHRKLCFAIDSPFAHELVSRLTQTGDENAVYISGIKLGRVRVLTRIVPVELESASEVRAIARPNSCAKALIALHEAGLPLVAMAHSHPGSGPSSTFPSSIDLRYLETVQKSGAGVIGVIVNRDCYVRFFTASLPFRVKLQGSDFVPVDGDRNVFKLRTRTT